MTSTQQLPKLGASACVWKNGKVLLIQRAKPPVGLWSLPGGHVEFGETTAAAAARELLEETGVRADLAEFVGLYEVISEKPSLHYAIACYCGHWKSGDAVAASDALNTAWVLQSDLYHFDYVPHILEAITRARVLLKL